MSRLDGAGWLFRCKLLMDPWGASAQLATLQIQPDGSKDRPFDPFLSARTERLRCIVADVTNQIENYEQHFSLRERARKVADQKIFEQTLEAMICDLAYRYLFDPSQQVFLSLSHRHLGRKSRYRSPALGKKLPDLLHSLSSHEMGFVEMTKGTRVEVWSDDEGMRFEGKRTTLKDGRCLISRIIEHGIELSDFERSECEEVIILKSPKRGPKDTGTRLEYEDTVLTERCRKDVRALNRWLANADLMVFDNAIDLSDTRLRRIFNNGKFDHGGRLFGGFWQAMKKSERLEKIEISNKPVVELDFGQMALRLLYGKTAAPLPEGDLYRIPGLEPYQEGVKKIINSALFADKAQSRMPLGSRKDFPDRIEHKQVLGAIQSYHQPVFDLFFSGVGMKLMFLESEVLVGVLFDLMEMDVVALPIHDASLVSCEHAETAKDSMLRIFEENTGIEM